MGRNRSCDDDCDGDESDVAFCAGKSGAVGVEMDRRIIVLLVDEAGD